MDDVVDPAEEITRFLRNSSHLQLGVGRPHVSAFMPRVQNGDISVYRTFGMARAEVIDLGVRYVGRPDLPLKGHCSLAAKDIFLEGLVILAAPDPNERHANVRGWAADPKIRIIAKRLVDKATLAVY